ncbi:MAG TPA: CoA pyrophosphatase [Gemmatimonadaceae bacterium]|nr:CoA pyrophosphatase [Gemmatimonadaceae bacterium]
MERLGGGERAGRELTAPQFIDRLAAAFATRDAALAERDPPFSEAAVALTLVPRGDDLLLLLMQRATNAADPWSGQVSLPGGRFEPADDSLLSTAIRETHEETAVDLTSARVLGVLDELRPRTPTLPPVIVRPFVLTIPSVPRLTPSSEVAELFWTPLGTLFDPRSAGRREVTARGRRFTVDAIDVDGRVIWGMTERILRSFEPIWSAAK